MPTQSSPDPLRIAFVAGVTVRKWTTVWAERHPGIPLEVIPLGETEGSAIVRAGEAELAFVRLPVDRSDLSVIRLYGEVAVLVVSRDSELATRESLTVAEVTELDGVVEFPPTGAVKDAVALVAAGVGSLRLPHSLARSHARKDVVALPITDAPETDIALVWLTERTTPEVEEFVGIVRGRTAASSRATPTPPTVKVRSGVKVQSKNSHAARRKRKGR